MGSFCYVSMCRKAHVKCTSGLALVSPSSLRHVTVARQASDVSGQLKIDKFKVVKSYNFVG